MLKGCDLSHWNSNSLITSDLDFVICKATEGNTFRDKSFEGKLNMCKSKKIDLVGAYHFAKTNQDVIKNVDNFLSVVTKREEFGKTMILALDIEGADILRKNCWSWCLKWCKLVYEKTGIRPVVYTSSYYTKYMKDLCANNFGLWIANWNVKAPKFKVYPFWAIWQYTSKPFDKDYFNGNKEQYLKYCIPNIKEGD